MPLPSDPMSDTYGTGPLNKDAAQIPPPHAELQGPTSVSAVVLERLGRAEPIARRSGTRAELAGLRAQLRAARTREDLDLERAAATKLARRLVSMGAELEQATKLARRSLLLGDEPRLREELSAWFASLGRVALAAGTLEPLLDRTLPPKERARLWTRIAVLKARAADGAGATAALARAAEADRTDPLPVELLGALNAWAPEVMTPLRSARALVEASLRREARGDERGALESVLQAFILMPGHRPAAERLARYLGQAGRFQAADEVWRRCAAAFTAPEQQEIHARRLREALGAGAPALALGAAIDARGDTRLDADGLATAVSLVNEGAGTTPTPNFDGLLFAVGLGELLAARLRVAALTQEPAARARNLLALARMLAGPLASPDRAAQVLVELLEQDPKCEAAFTALSEYSTHSGDHIPMVEVLVRIGLGDARDPAVALRLEQLAQIAAHWLRDPAPGVWALARLTERGPLPDELLELQTKLRQRAEKAVAWSVPSDWRRLSLAEMRRALDYLTFRPELSTVYADALGEMQRREPQSARWARMLERVYVRLSRSEQLEQLWQSTAIDPAVRIHGQLRLVLRSDNPKAALGLLVDRASWPALLTQETASEVSALLATIASVHGTAEQRAQGFVWLSHNAKPTIKAVLLSIASEHVLTLGDRELAARVSEAACRQDPQTARAFVAYAEAMSESRALVAGLAFERATQLVLPRPEWCRALSEVASGAEQRATRVRWLKRWASLAPLDRDAAQALLDELSRGDDAAELESALDWLIAQPRPRAHLAQGVTRAALRLTELAPVRGRGFARRLLGVFGVDDAAVVSMLTELAARLGDPSLRLALIERLLAEGSDSAAELLIEAARLRADGGDPDLAVDCLVRALHAGAESEEVSALLASFAPRNTSEGELRELELRTLLAERDPALPAEQRSLLLRQLGAAYWDLAGDRALALEAFVRGAAADPYDGDVVLARDLVAFLGYQDALEELSSLAKRESPERAASLLLALAGVALVDGFSDIAVRLAWQVLDLSPQRAEALAVLERALSSEQIEELERAYQRVDDAVLGCYATRALHYRAARQFERRSENSRALDHAITAFQAVPSEGVSFGLMLRLASLSGRDKEVGRVLTGVAEQARDTRSREFWLERAARAMGTDAEGQALRVEVLLRALSLRGETAAVEGVGRAMSALLLLSPERAPELAQQFATACRALLRNLESGGAAAVAMAIARVSAECFASAPLVSEALVRAWQLEPQGSALEACSGFTELLQTDAEAARRLVEAVTGVGEGASAPFVQLALQLAELFLPSSAPRLAVWLAVLCPNDLTALARARSLAVSAPELLAELNQIIPPAQQAAVVFSRVQQLDHAPRERVELLETLLGNVTVDANDYRRCFDLLRSALIELGDSASLEKHLTQALDAARLTADQRAFAARELAHLLHQRQAHAAALDIYVLLEQTAGLSLGDIQAASSIARASGDVERELRYVLEHERRLSLDGQQSAVVVRRLGELHVACGNRAAARECFERLLQLSPNDSAAFEYMLDDAERTEDYPHLAQLLEVRLARQNGDPEVVHRLFTIYQERLGRPDAARSAVERALALRGEDAELLELLGAHLAEQGAKTEAARVYLRAARLAREPRRAAHFAARACRCFIDAGAESEAREILEVKGLYSNTETLSQLRVELARKSPDKLRLADALEELAFASMGVPEERAAALREAAELSLGLGNFELALTRAQRAARIAPLDPPAQLYAKLLEYKKRGAGTKPDAQRTISELRGMLSSAKPELIELRAFLLAEALDKRSTEGNPGQRELIEAENAVGRRPLVALGLAERYDMTQHFAEAAECYLSALSGELFDVRPRTALILQAARASSRAGQLPRARGLLGMITPDDPRFSEAELLEQSLRRLEEDYLHSQGRQERALRPSPSLLPRAARLSGKPKTADSSGESPAVRQTHPVEAAVPQVAAIPQAAAQVEAAVLQVDAAIPEAPIGVVDVAPVEEELPPPTAASGDVAAYAGSGSIEPSAVEVRFAPTKHPGSRPGLRNTGGEWLGAKEYAPDEPAVELRRTAAPAVVPVTPAAEAPAMEGSAAGTPATEALAAELLPRETKPAAVAAPSVSQSAEPSGGQDAARVAGSTLVSRRGGALLPQAPPKVAPLAAVERPHARTQLGLGLPNLLAASQQNARQRPPTRPPAPAIGQQEGVLSPFDAAASALENASRDPAQPAKPERGPATTDASRVEPLAASPVLTSAVRVLPVYSLDAAPALPRPAPALPKAGEPEAPSELFAELAAADRPGFRAAPEEPSLEVGVVALEDVAADFREQVFADEDAQGALEAQENTRAETPSSVPPSLRPGGPSTPPQARLEKAAMQSFPPQSQSERSLLDGLRGGSLEAGQRLLRLLDGQAERSHDLVNVCRMLVSLAPGDAKLLETLHGAAVRDNDIVYANAIRHAMRIFDAPASAPSAPPLHQQLEQTDALLSLIAGPSQAGQEALGLVWQYAPQLFKAARKDRVWGRRVRVDDASPVASLTLTVSRLLGCSRVALFEAQGEKASFELGLDQPMAVIVKGPIAAETPTFRFHFGRVMLAARPEFAVVMGLPEEELRVVLSAVLAAFGPPRRLEGDVARVAQFAERLWELLPPRAQRRIGELCETPGAMDPRLVLQATQRALSRAGLFVSGDLGVAVREVVAAQGLQFDWARAGTLQSVCEGNEAVADLVRLATSIEYSDARWRGGRSVSSVGRAMG